MNFPTIDRSFFAGECFDAYRVLGAHPCRDDFGQEGWRFAVWAPGAVAVEICGMRWMKEDIFRQMQICTLISQAYSQQAISALRA